MAELAIDLAPTDDDRLDQAEALVRSYCGWHIAPSRTETVTLRAFGMTSLMLPSLYVTGVASVVDDDTTLVLTTDYRWVTNGILDRVDAYWGAADIAVTFTPGYDDPPAEVTAVVQAIAKRAIDNPGSLTRVTRGPFTDVYSATGANQATGIALLESERAVLSAYRIPRVS